VIVVPSVEEIEAMGKNPGGVRKPASALSAPVAPEKPAAPQLDVQVARGRTISFACPVCHTPMKAAEEELGHTIMCPHCFSPVVAGGELQKKGASAPPEPRSLVLEDSGDEDYQLADEVVQRPSVQPLLSTSPPAESSAPRAEPKRDEARNRDRETRPRDGVKKNKRDHEKKPDGGNRHAEKKRDDARRATAAPATSAPSFDDDEYALAAEEDRPRVAPAVAPPAEDDTPLEEERPRRPRAAAPTSNAAPLDPRLTPQNRPSIEERLAAAQAKRGPIRPPDHPFVEGVVSFLFQPSALGRWIGLIVGTAIVYFFAASSIRLGMAGGTNLFLSLLFGVMAAAAGLLLVMFEAVVALSVVQDTAAGEDEIANWPDYVFIDWVGQAFYLLNAIAFAAAPGFIVASFLDTWGPWRWALPVATGVVLFPIILLSQLDGGSPFSLLTGTMLQSLARLDAWAPFYAMEAVVLGIAGAGAWLAYAVLGGRTALEAIVVGVLATTALLVLSRLIGRLAWCLEEEEVVIDRRDQEEQPTEFEQESID
jgi:hypothetical protein